MNNFKVRCVKSETACFTVGNIYKVKGNNIIGDNVIPVSIIGCSCVEDINRTIASQFELVEESEAVESIIPEPNYKELYDHAMQELKEVTEKNIRRDNYAKIGEILYQSANVFLSGFLADAHDDTKDLFDKIPKNLGICEVEVQEFINDFVNFRTKSIVNPIQKLSEERNLEIEKLAEVNGNLVRSNMNKDSEIKQLKKCLKKQYKFIDKLLPERIEV